MNLSTETIYPFLTARLRGGGIVVRSLVIAALVSGFLGATASKEAVADDMADPAEINRTNPDLVVYDPTGGVPRAWNDPEFLWLNEHILVQPTTDGALLATWTAERWNPKLSRVMYSRSEDGGTTWDTAQQIDESTAAWQVPVISPTGRIYLFYTYGSFSGGFPCRTSDDHGRTWSDKFDLEFAKGPTDNPQTSARASWISPTVPHWDSQGRPLIGFTRWATNPAYPTGVTGHSQAEFFRIDNLQDNPDPADLQLTWLNLDDPITVPHAQITGASYAQEPYTVGLPDGRLFTTMRSGDGNTWYTVSSDDGQTWRDAEPLRFRDDGEIMHQPSSPCPVFHTDRGDYLFLFNNNDGYSAGHDGPEDRAARRPAYLCRGEFRPDSHQPIWWSHPELLIDNNEVKWGPPGEGRLEAAAYTSFTEHQGRRVLWYPDRKGFLLGKFLPDDLLDAMDVPSTGGTTPWIGVSVGISAYFNQDTIINAPGDNTSQGYRPGIKSEYFATEAGSAAISGGDGVNGDGTDVPNDGLLTSGPFIFALGPLTGSDANTILLNNDGGDAHPSTIELDIADASFGRFAVLYSGLAVYAGENGKFTVLYTDASEVEYVWDLADWTGGTHEGVGEVAIGPGLDFYRENYQGEIINTTDGSLFIQDFDLDESKTVDKVTFALDANVNPDSDIGIYALSGANSAIPGDANGDGYVNDEDASILAAHWQMTGMTWGNGDFNDDQIVNDADASILAANWQSTGEEGAPVPEPAMLVLLTAGLLALGFRKRRTVGDCRNIGGSVADGVASCKSSI